MNIAVRDHLHTHIARLLEAAKALIENPENWTRYTLARTADGRPVSPKSPMAVSFDVSGAMQHSDPVTYRNYKTGLPDATLSPAWLVFNKIIGPDVSVSGFNDNNSHEDVLDAFDRAIAIVMVPR
jgi:hypothetical protein